LSCRAVIPTLALIGLCAGCAPKRVTLEGFLAHPATTARVTYVRDKRADTNVELEIRRRPPESWRHDLATFTIWVAPLTGGEYEAWGSISISRATSATVRFNTVRDRFKLLVTEEHDPRPLFPSRRVVLSGAVDTAPPLPRRLGPISASLAP
jgi:hypothetical protein